MTTPSWYDVLDVAPDATTEQIRTAWQDALRGLDPGDRRFKQRNRAAEVLLDPVRRAAHDEELEAAEAENEPAEDPTEEPTLVGSGGSATATATAPITVKKQAEAPTRGSRLSGRLKGLTVGLGVLALVLVVATALALGHVGDGGTDTTSAVSSDGLPSDAQVADAVTAARSAIVPVLAYNYRHLAHDERAAQAVMTPSYAKTYGNYFSQAVIPNAPRTKTVVQVNVLDAGVVRTGPSRVDVLLFVNRPTTNAQGSKIYHDQVTARMLDTDGTWLVDCLITSTDGTCGS